MGIDSSGGLISLLLQSDSLLPEPYLYLTSYFNARRSEYVDHLLAVSQRGEWEEWLLFFLRGVQSQADEVHQRANLLVDLPEDYQQRYQSEQSENILELVIRLFEDSYLDVNTAAEWLDVEYSTANRMIGQFEDDGIPEQLTGKERIGSTLRAKFSRLSTSRSTNSELLRKQA